MGKSWHNKEIEKGRLGYPDKILEEFLEFTDSIEQDIKLMALLELSDILGATEAYYINSLVPVPINHDAVIEPFPRHIGRHCSDEAKKNRYTEDYGYWVGRMEMAIRNLIDNENTEINNLHYRCIFEIVKSLSIIINRLSNYSLGFEDLVKMADKRAKCSK